jgi:hypothetical protein
MSNIINKKQIYLYYFLSIPNIPFKKIAIISEGINQSYVGKYKRTFNKY